MLIIDGKEMPPIIDKACCEIDAMLLNYGLRLRLKDVVSRALISPLENHKFPL